MSSVWSRPNTSESPPNPRTAFEFTTPPGQESRNFARNKRFGVYMGSTRKVIMKLSFSLLDQISEQKIAKRVKVRSSKVLSISEKTRRLDALEDFYDHLHTALCKASSATVSFMNKTMIDYDRTLEQQKSVRRFAGLNGVAIWLTPPTFQMLDELLADTARNDGMTHEKHLGGMTLQSLKVRHIPSPRRRRIFLTLHPSTCDAQFLIDAKDRNSLPDSEAELSSPQESGTSRSEQAASQVPWTSSAASPAFVGYGSSPPTTPSRRHRSPTKRTLSQISRDTFTSPPSPVKRSRRKAGMFKSSESQNTKRTKKFCVAPAAAEITESREI
ncbi:hypothetical protein P7C70_g1500, partial [Phenoliferia sp. Uapishka_3]